MDEGEGQNWNRLQGGGGRKEGKKEEKKQDWNTLPLFIPVSKNLTRKKRVEWSVGGWGATIDGFPLSGRHFFEVGKRLRDRVARWVFEATAILAVTAY